MSAVAATVSSLIGNLLNPIPSGKFVDSNGNTLYIQVTLEETATDRVQVTDHPVEAGAQISDHAFYRPAEVTMRCGWSNSSANSLTSETISLFSSGAASALSAVNALGALAAPPTSGGGLLISDFVSGVYSQLLSIQQTLLPITLYTSIRQYNNMMLTEVSLTRDQKTSQALMVTATLRQVILVSTVSAVLAPLGNQATPSNTAENITTGAQNLQTGSPSEGGAAPSSTWANGLE